MGNEERRERESVRERERERICLHCNRIRYGTFDIFQSLSPISTSIINFVFLLFFYYYFIYYHYLFFFITVDNVLKITAPKKVIDL